MKIPPSTMKCQLVWSFRSCSGKQIVEIFMGVAFLSCLVDNVTAEFLVLWLLQFFCVPLSQYSLNLMYKGWVAL